MKVLVIRFSSIGDIVLTTPVVRCLKQQRGEIEVHYLTKEAFRMLVENNPNIDRCHFLGDDFAALVASLRAERFDYIIDLHRNLRTRRVKRALKVPSHSFHKLNVRKWLLTALKINILPSLHIVDRYMKTVEFLQVRNDGRGLDYSINTPVPVDDLPLTHAAGYVGIAIGGALGTKKLPLHKLRELCSLIPQPVVLLGGPEDAATGEVIAADDPIKIYNACGKFSLDESADLVRRANILITHDTGLMHIGAALQRPILSVWGNTVPAFGMGPYYGAASSVGTRAFEVKPLWCRPCSKIGYARCPLGNFKCMEKQDLEKIAEAVNFTK